MQVAPRTKGVERQCKGIALAVFAMTTGLAWGGTLRACASDVDFPPFVLTSSSGFASGAQNTGLAVNVLQRALRRAGREPAVIERLPWRRCRESVASGEFQIAMDVPTPELDTKQFAVTQAYAEIHHVYFYAPSKYQDAPPVRSLSDLKRYHVCALAGSHLDAFGIDRDHQDTGAMNERSAIIKVATGRCDVFIEYREVVDSLFAHDASLRDLFNTSGIRRLDLPGDTPTGLHFEFSRSLPDGQALQRSFNATIQYLIENREIIRMTP